MEIRLEGHDNSNPGQLDLSAYAEVLTSLEGYSTLSAEVNVIASSSRLQSKASAHWDSLSYELRCIGELQTLDLPKYLLSNSN